MEDYAAIRMNELNLYATTWVNLTDIMVGRGNQTQTSTHHTTPFIES